MKGQLVILLTGASGLVGSGIGRKEYLTPTHRELDITHKRKVEEYVRKFRPEVIIHAADFTDVSRAEGERGERSGECWRVTVEGTRNIADVARRFGAYVIFFSTGSVFSGTKNNPGPFRETDTTSPLSRLSWHGYAKAVAEQCVLPQGAVIRISHPVSRCKERDYLHKALRLYAQKKLYPLFTDQFFSITCIDELRPVIRTLIAGKETGIFHVASGNFTTPYELVRFALKQKEPKLATTTFSEFIKHVKMPLRYSQYSALRVEKTQKRLGISFSHWQEIVDRTLLQ